LSFDVLNLHASLSRAIHELGFEKPTEVQAQAVPQALAGRDLLASASTGSGKTAAFLLPILQRMLLAPGRGTRALVLSPTRELAQQIADDAFDLARHTRLRVAAVYGGVAMGPQERALRDGVELVVATPGRLLDHLRSGTAKFPGLEVLVLDEADRMLDMGFLPDVRRVLAALPKQRQTLFFSATMPAPIAALAGEMLRDPAVIRLVRDARPAATIAQSVFLVDQDRKAELLAALLERGDVDDALVFTRTKHRADRLTRYLTARKVSAERIHGNRSQRQRTEALERFRSGRYRVLVATDVAARGIDVEQLGHVVNFDVPAVPEDYVHRVGRTGRAEATGDAFTFVSPQEVADLRRIERAIGKSLPRLSVPGFEAKAPQAAAGAPGEARRPFHARRSHGASRGGRRHAYARS
jgi:ATP-dependent RNA helicase RhlE